MGGDRSHCAILRSTLGLLVAGVALASPASSFADLMLPLGEGSVTVDGHRAIIARTGQTESLIFEITLRSTARTFVWLRTYPTEPRLFDAVEKPFDRLAASTVVRPPFNQLIRDDLFGPSVVTVLVDRLSADRTKDDVLNPTIAPRRLTALEPEFFTGQVTSSTTTYDLFLPETLAQFLSTRGAKLDQRQIADLAGPLNRGWTIAATVVQDSGPDESRPAVIGPVGVRFSSPHALYPLVPRTQSTGTGMPFELFVISTEPLVSSAFETVWDVRPWEGVRKKRGTFYVDYNAIIEAESDVAIEVTERQTLPALPNARLLRMSFVQAHGKTEPLTLVAARSPIDIPSGTRRGSVFDLFLTILLGLTPLLYTPESWFLLWIASRARARARREGSAFGVKLWSFFAIAVGLYWFVVLPGAARIAGVVPLMIGIAQLAWPYTARDPSPVRAQFKKRKAKS